VKTIVTLLLLGAGLLVGGARPAAARPLELVIAHENLVLAGAELEPSLQAFARRIEELTGWPKGSFRAKAFTRPAEALAYIKKQRTAFAILPVHQFAEGRKDLKLEVLGRAVGPDGVQLAFQSVTRRPASFDGVGNAAGKRVAMTDIHDPVWVTMMFDGNVDVRGLHLLETPSTAAAVQAVVDKQADIAIVPEGEWTTTYEKRAQPTGDLEWVFRSGIMPPSAFLAVGKHVTAAERAAMAGVVDKICRTTGGAACGGIGIVYIEAGRAESYANVLELYDVVRAHLPPGPRRR
jgi:hypothetical protein